MGERATGLSGITAERGSSNGGSPREEARRIEGEIAKLREDLGALVAELDRRRHELTDVRLQLRRHARAVTVGALTLVGAAAGLAWLKLGRARRGRAMAARAEWIPRVLARVIDRGRPAHAEPGIGQKILITAATGTLGPLMSIIAARLVSALLNRAPAGPTASRRDSGRRAA
jgi:hypothetical protein